MTDVTAELVALIARYVGYSATMDFAAKRTLWDADDPAPLLMPEEAEAPYLGWAEMESYWSKSRDIMTGLASRSANHRCRLIEPDVALVTYDMRWIAVLRGARKPISADVRVTALLRLKPEGWRFFHLMEGPIDMLAMAKAAAERRAGEIL